MICQLSARQSTARDVDFIGFFLSETVEVVDLINDVLLDLKVVEVDHVFDSMVAFWLLSFGY